MQLNQLLKLMTEKGASDLHLRPMRPPLLRIDGKLLPIEAEPLKPDVIKKMIEPILTPQQQERFERTQSVDLGYGVHGLAHFRGNIFQQRGTIAVTFRRIPYEIMGVDELELPDVLLEMCTLPMGLVLVTGPTGSGKSTTLAALIRHISETRHVHVITIEDPIEFLFTDGASSISQREVGTDTGSFTEALRNSLRQDPDVIMVGEMRDPETIGTVITAAETGHLVFSTLHTNSAPQSLDRILDSFPVNQQKQVRAQLSQVLKGVISMKLIQRRGGKGRVAVLEIMRASPRIAALIEKGDTGALHEELESSVSYYRMQSMNQSLLALLVHGTISYKEAMRESPDPEDLSLKLRKMFPAIEERGDDMPSTADFSQILELQQFKKLYEEQEDRHKLRETEKDKETVAFKAKIAEREQQMEKLAGELETLRGELEKSRGEHNRLRVEAQEKIDKLSERIKQLNQQLLAK